MDTNSFWSFFRLEMSLSKEEIDKLKCIFA
jgi:hypothetical protein